MLPKEIPLAVPYAPFALLRFVVEFITPDEFIVLISILLPFGYAITLSPPLPPRPIFIVRVLPFFIELVRATLLLGITKPDCPPVPP